MSRLQTYLNEKDVILPVDHVNDIKKSIQDKCKPYLSLTKDMMFYRAMNTPNDNRQYAGIKLVRQDRKSRGMDKKGANNVNSWLEEHGHMRRDQSVFAVSDKTKLGLYGSSKGRYVIYPVGKFDYTYIKVGDMNLAGRSEYGDAITALIRNIKMDLHETQLKEMFVTNKNIKEAYNKKYEIWFRCKLYYYLREDTI